MGLSHFQSSPDTWKVWRSISSNKKVEDKRAVLCSPSVQAYSNWGLNVLFFRRSTLLLDDWWRYRSTRFWDWKSRSKMGLVRDFKVWVIGDILWFTGLCLFVPVCCSGSHIFQTVAVLSASLRLEFVHLLRSVVRTRGLPRSCLSRVVSGCTSSFWSAVHFNEGGSGASVLSDTISCQMRCQFKTVFTKAGEAGMGFWGWNNTNSDKRKRKWKYPTFCHRVNLFVFFWLK